MSPTDTFIAVGKPALALIALVVVGWFVVAGIRRWMREGSESREPFTLDDLRELRREGAISESEFAKARDAMIGAIRRKAGSDRNRSSGSPGDGSLSDTGSAGGNDFGSGFDGESGTSD